MMRGNLRRVGLAVLLPVAVVLIVWGLHRGPRRFGELPSGPMVIGSAVVMPDTVLVREKPRW